MDHELALRPTSARERYVLADGDHEIAVLEGRNSGQRPVKVTINDLHALDPGLLLFAAFVVRGLTNDAIAAAAASEG